MNAADLATADPDESALWSQFVAGRSPEDRLALFERFALMARGIAARHYRRDAVVPISFPELIQLAYAGLLEAIDRFKPELGVPFRFFAARRIAGSVINGIASHCEINRQISVRRKIARERVQSISRGKLDTNARLDDALDTLGDLISGLALGFMLDDAAADIDLAPDPFETMAWRQTIDLLRHQVDQLPDRERLVVRLHYFDGLRFDQAAEILGLSKGRISQVHREAVTRLSKRLSSPANPFGGSRQRLKR